MITQFHTAVCPKCNATVKTCQTENVKARGTPLGLAYNAISYSCDSCHAILSIQMDPTSLENDIVKRLEKSMKVLLNRIS